jgi:hypothetical protein
LLSSSKKLNTISAKSQTSASTIPLGKLVILRRQRWCWVSGRRAERTYEIALIIRSAPAINFCPKRFYCGNVSRAGSLQIARRYIPQATSTYSLTGI